MVDTLISSFNELKEAWSKKMNTLSDSEEDLKKAEEEKISLEERDINIKKVRAILQDIAYKTQKNLEFHVSSLVTTSLKHVDIEWPDYEIEFVKRRNTTECDVFFVENERKQHPLDEGGGGACDVAAFSQLISYWTLKKNNPIFILDEPFRNVSPDLQDRISDMLKMLCKKLKLQILMVSHAEDVNIAADRTYVATKEGDVSELKILTN